MGRGPLPPDAGADPGGASWRGHTAPDVVAPAPGKQKSSQKCILLLPAKMIQIIQRETEARPKHRLGGATSPSRHF